MTTNVISPLNGSGYQPPLSHEASHTPYPSSSRSSSFAEASSEPYSSSSSTSSATSTTSAASPRRRLPKPRSWFVTGFSLGSFLKYFWINLLWPLSVPPVLLFSGVRMARRHNLLPKPCFAPRGFFFIFLDFIALQMWVMNGIFIFVVRSDDFKSLASPVRTMLWMQVMQCNLTILLRVLTVASKYGFLSPRDRTLLESGRLTPAQDAALMENIQIIQWAERPTTQSRLDHLRREIAVAAAITDASVDGEYSAPGAEGTGAEVFKFECEWLPGDHRMRDWLQREPEMWRRLQVGEEGRRDVHTVCCCVAVLLCCCVAVLLCCRVAVML